MDGEGIMSTQDSCYGGGSLAGAVIGTFLTTILLLAVAAFAYRQWRRHKGKHLVLVTNPEIVEDAYAFDNPCFKDATPAVNRNNDSRPLSTASLVVETSPATKDSARWSSPWSSLGLPSVNKNDRRRTLDDSCLGSKATRVSVVSLRSRDFTGLGFNVCGNMREGIFVKDLLHRGPASESGRIHPGDRIGSVKISFRSMVYEDALTILSYASPYDVELEVENGGSVAGSRPATLLKKTVGPSPSRICHPLYRSQSIPELSQTHKTSAKRLFIADPNESLGSNYSTMNSTMKSSKSTPGSHTPERRQDDAKSSNNSHHHKFGIKVLPALDGTVHRIENQNEHNTNLERRNSRRLDIDDVTREESTNSHGIRNIENFMRIRKNDDDDTRDRINENHQKHSDNPRQRNDKNPETRNIEAFDRESSMTRSITNGHDATDTSVLTEASPESLEMISIPSEVPAEVHNAAMAARRNRKSSLELLNVSQSANIDAPSLETLDHKSPQKNKRKAPAPPITTNDEQTDRFMDATKIRDTDESISRSSVRNDSEIANDGIEIITDYTEFIADEPVPRSSKADKDDRRTSMRLRATDDDAAKGSQTDSDNESEIHDSFTTIELKPADITIHHGPIIDDPANVESSNEARYDDDDVYRKAASLGDLSKYENKTLAILERAKSLDMADAATKKRKHGTTDDMLNESTEDLTRIDDSFDARKLRKSNEWGNLEDAIWKKRRTCEIAAMDSEGSGNNTKDDAASFEILNDAAPSRRIDSPGRLGPIEMPDETSMELYDLPLSIRMSDEFIGTERIFDPDVDDSLARIVNDARIVKSPTPMEAERDLRRFELGDSSRDDGKSCDNPETGITKLESSDATLTRRRDVELEKALRCLDRETSVASIGEEATGRSLVDETTRRPEILMNEAEARLTVSPYAGLREVEEEPMRRINVVTGCPGCDRKHSRNEHSCRSRLTANDNDDGMAKKRDNLDWQPQKLYPESPQSAVNDDIPMSAYEIGITKFEKIRDDETRSPTKSPIEKKLMRERGIEIDETNETREHNESKMADRETGTKRDFTETDEDTEDRELERDNVGNVSVLSVDKSDDSGLVDESGDYDRRDYDSRPPLPVTPMPSSGPIQKLAYITEISVSPENLPVKQHERGNNSPVARRDNNVKPPRMEANLSSNGRTTTTNKKPPVPPRRNDSSRIIQSRENENSDKQAVYVQSEYRTSGGRDKNENTEKIMSLNQVADVGRPSDGKKIENWIYLGDNGEQNPWGNGSSQQQQQQQITSIVVTAVDDKKKAHHQ